MQTKMTDIINAKLLTREFVVGDQKVMALRGISFIISAGEFVTIMGASGSGKSTLLNILGCLDTPSGGEYLLDGIAVKSMTKIERARLRNLKIGFVFQTYNLLPRTTALENVELPLMYNSAISQKERREKAIHVLESVGLADRMNHMPNQMSGGQQQRVAIARALVNDPVIILADEATGNLDTRTSYEIMALFQHLNSEGKTIAFVTHEPDIALFSQRSILLRDGRIKKDEKINKPSLASESLANMPAEEEIEAYNS
jgi:putative ABC transport system ATP-binding protein